MKINTCIIWDTLFPNQYWKKKASRVLNQTDFKTFDFSEVELIYVLAELNWDAKKRAGFYGFELIKDLRMNKKILCPIVICSFMPGFGKSNHSYEKILDTPGHYLLKLPTEPNELNNYKGIDEDILYDINMHTFDFIGKLHGEMHDLVNLCNSLVLKSLAKRDLKILVIELTKTKLNEFNKYILDERKVEYSFLVASLINELSHEIDVNSDLKKANRINEIFEIYKVQIYSMIPVTTSEIDKVDFPQKRWSVLFIDDMETTCDKVSEMFDIRGIKCYTANNSNDAFRILLADEEKEQKIAVVISDFRLYENGFGGKWQNLQGYQILKAVHEQSEVYKSHYAYSLLTSKRGTILDWIRKGSNFPITWFYKSDVLSNDTAFNIFCQRICEIGSEAFFRKHNIPNTSIWTKGIDRIDYGYYYYYKQHIESLDFDTAEREINIKAIANINNVKKKKKLLDEFNYQIALVFKEKKGKKEITNNAYDLLTKFRDNILTARRIYWGLYILLGLDKSAIFKILKKDYPEGADEKTMETMMKGVLTTSLGISFNASPSSDLSSSYVRYGLLNEEIEFLEKNAKPFEKDVSYIRTMNENIDILRTFFFRIECLDEVPEISVISKKLMTNNNYRINYAEFKSCVKKIKKKKFDSGNFNGKFRNVTYSFYKDSIDDLSDDVKNILLSLKHW